MADLSELNSSQPVKIAGADTTGLETNFVNSTSAGELFTIDMLQGNPVCGAITVGTSLVEAKVGASRATGRKAITIFHNGSGSLYYGCSTMTTSAGTPIFKNTSVTIPCGPNSPVYLISNLAGQDVRIIEWV